MCSTFVTCITSAQQGRIYGTSECTLQQPWKINRPHQRNTCIVDWVQCFYFKHAARVKRHGYFILNCFSKDISDAEVSHFIARRPSKFGLQTFSALHDGNLGPFMEERVSTASANIDMCTSIIGTGNGAQDKAEESAGETHYSLSMRLLMERLESKLIQWIARRREALDVWRGWIATSMDVDEGDRSKTSSPVTEGRYLLTGVDRKLQVLHSDVRVCKRDYVAYFAIVNEKEEEKPNECRGSHHFNFYLHLEKDGAWQIVLSYFPTSSHRSQFLMGTATWNMHARNILVNPVLNITSIYLIMSSCCQNPSFLLTAGASA